MLQSLQWNIYVNYHIYSLAFSNKCRPTKFFMLSTDVYFEICYMTVFRNEILSNCCEKDWSNALLSMILQISLIQFYVNNLY